MNKVKEFIGRLELRWSDLFLSLMLLSGIVIFMESIALYGVCYSTSTNIPTWLLIILYVIMVGSLIAYIVFDEIRDHTKHNYLALAILFTTIILEAFTILMTPDTVIMTVHDLSGEIKETVTTFSFEVKLVHFFAYFYLVNVFYIGLFVLPKRIKNLVFISALVYVFYAASLFIFVYSLFVDDYIKLFSYFFKPSEEIVNPKAYAPKSFFDNKNMLGMYDEIGVFVAFINYALTKKKYNLGIAIFFYLHMFLTLCEAGIIITTGVLFLLTIFFLIVSIKQKRKKLLITCSSLLGTSLTIFLVLVILINTNVAIHDKFYYLIKTYTLDQRIQLWSYSLQITQSTSLFKGAGYGTYNSILSSMPMYTYREGTPVTHSWFFSLLGRGGIFNLVIYIGLLVLFVYECVKTYKYNKLLIIFIITFALNFFIHTFVEDKYYVTIFLTMLVITYKKMRYPNG